MPEPPPASCPRRAWRTSQPSPPPPKPACAGTTQAAPPLPAPSCSRYTASRSRARLTHADARAHVQRTVHRLLDVFDQAEDLEATDALHTLYRIIRNLSACTRRLPPPRSPPSRTSSAPAGSCKYAQCGSSVGAVGAAAAVLLNDPSLLEVMFQKAHFLRVMGVLECISFAHAARGGCSARGSHGRAGM
jgi:hypothetical protein